MQKENKNTSIRVFFLNTGTQRYFYHRFAFRWHCLLFAKVALLADAKAGEDGCEDVLGGDCAGDFAEVV